jgi:CBS domain-containing protein
MEKSVFAGVSDISALMSKKVWHVEPETTARYALSLMARHAISGVVVVEDGKPVGVFTERNAVRMITSGSDLTHHPVGEAQIAPAVCIDIGATPHQAIALMQNKAVRRLVVLNGQGGIVGILTQTDLSRPLDCCDASEKQHLADQAAKHQSAGQAEVRI